MKGRQKKVDDLKSPRSEKPRPQASKSIEAFASPPLESREEASPYFVCFRVDDRLYALSLEHVERTLRMVALTPLPETPPWVGGVINLQGQVVPAIDLRARFGALSREPRPDDRLLVVWASQRRVALMVDEVSEVLKPSAGEVQPPDGPLARSKPLAAVIRRREEVVLVLDPESLLPPEEGF